MAVVVVVVAVMVVVMWQWWATMIIDISFLIIENKSIYDIT